MFRIVHISDLHIKSEGPAATRVQKAVRRLQKALDLELNIAGHSQDKLNALKTRLCALRPDVIVVTGDISTYGDRASLEDAVRILKDLEDATRVKRVICVPGNHDSLGERVKHLSKNSWLPRRLFKVLQFLNKDLQQIIERGAPLPLLQSYKETVAKEFERPDPAKPIEVETDWGRICFFCFDSTNDPGPMANEGRISPAQYNALCTFLDNPENQTKLKSSLLIAVLHHHPLPIPYQRDDAFERFYNSMCDGSTLCHFLNTRRFHFVLHGHQHKPYACAVRYAQSSEQSLNIIAAGTALQVSKIPSRDDSFNVLDILSPLYARLRLFEYTGTGFQEAKNYVALDVVPMDNFRVMTQPGQTKTSADTALQSLLRVVPTAIDDQHECDEISIQVEITKDEKYLGHYRIKGKCRAQPTSGLKRVITGSPPRKWEELALKTQDNLASNPLGIDLIADNPNQKVFRIVHSTEKCDGDPFDITYDFTWQCSPSEPNHFDAFNLMYFTHPVKRFSYSVTLPWMPVGPSVRACGLTVEDVKRRESLEDLGSGTWRYSFKIDGPRSVGLLIWLGPKGRQPPWR